MSTVTIQMPDALATQLREVAATSGVTLDQFLSSAAAEKLSAWQTVEYLRQRKLGYVGLDHAGVELGDVEEFVE